MNALAPDRGVTALDVGCSVSVVRAAEVPDAGEGELLRRAIADVLELIAIAMVLDERCLDNGRPFLAYCARELQRECHEMLDVIEETYIGWEPTNHANG